MGPFRCSLVPTATWIAGQCSWELHLVYLGQPTQENMFGLAKNTVMQDSILTTKLQANILHRKIYVLYSVLSGWKSWPFFCKNQLGFFCCPKQFRVFIYFNSEHLNKDSYVGFKRSSGPVIYGRCASVGELGCAPFCFVRLNYSRLTWSSF